MKNDAQMAEMAFEPLVAAAKGNARALLMLAEKALQRADPVRAYELVDEAKAAAPGNKEIAAIGGGIIAGSIPGWHVRMVKDQPRNKAFQDAIERAVTPNKRVLDIGSGSGLLAMMAARAGAVHVHSCEMNPAVAAVAAEIVADNGYADHIKMHSKSSRLLDVQADLGGKPEIIVSEIVGNDLVCEEVLPTMLDTARRLAAPGAQFIPARGDVRVALAFWERLEDRYLGEECGFDLRGFNRVVPSRFDARQDDSALHVRGEPVSLYSFDFSSAEQWQDRASMELISSGGAVNGVIQWVKLTMDDVGIYENPPGSGIDSHWGALFFPFEKPVETSAGEGVAIAATVAGSRLRIWQEC
jgi:type III protein arginine methyltransferase